MNMFPLRSGIRKKYMFSSWVVNILLELLVTAIRQEKLIKNIQIRKVEIKLSLCTDDYYWLCRKFLGTYPLKIFPETHK